MVHDRVCCAGHCSGVWRNSLLFSPTTKYGGYSYADVMTTPLAEAMRDALTAAAKLGKLYTPPDASRPVVYMGLQGESWPFRATSSAHVGVLRVLFCSRWHDAIDMLAPGSVFGSLLLW
jgi:hypothetical protein